MRAYDVALFIHLLGVITLFLAMGLLQRGGARIRQAETLEHLRLWLGLVQTTRGMFPAAVVMLLATGLYMTADVWTFETPWVVTAIVGLLGIAILGALLVGRRFARIGRAAGTAGEGPVPPELARAIEDATPWVALSANNGAAIGILWLMATKPSWTGSIAVVVVLALVGALVGFASVRRGFKDTLDAPPANSIRRWSNE